MSQVHSCFKHILLPCAAPQLRRVWLKPVLECVLRSGTSLLAAGSFAHGVGDLQVLVWASPAASMSLLRSG